MPTSWFSFAASELSLRAASPGTTPAAWRSAVSFSIVCHKSAIWCSSLAGRVVDQAAHGLGQGVVVVRHARGLRVRADVPQYLPHLGFLGRHRRAGVQEGKEIDTCAVKEYLQPLR